MSEYQCKICHANGNDMRTLQLRWMVNLQEYIPEAESKIRTKDGNEIGRAVDELRTCKTCRHEMLKAMAEVCKERRELRKYVLTPDGEEILTRYVLKGEKPI